jgi:hypothetical protein
VIGDLGDEPIGRSFSTGDLADHGRPVAPVQANERSLSNQRADEVIE